MESEVKKVLKTLNPRRVWLPVAIGLAVPLYLFYQEGQTKSAPWALAADGKPLYLLLAVVAFALRDVGYIQRFRVLTHKQLSWSSSFYISVLWEFSSAVTPSTIGGGFVAIFLLMREGISFGRALAYIIVISIFDNVLFLVAASLGFWGAYDGIFAQMHTASETLGTSISWAFWCVQTFVACYTAAMAFAIFVRPTFFKWTLCALTSVGFLKRWNPAAHKQGDEMILASKAMQGKRASYWLGVLATTFIAWSMRYCILNCIAAAYKPLNWDQHVMLFGRQVVMWTLMLASPTPGSSGTAEFFYQKLYGGAMQEYTLITNILWRVLTYYLYLLLGIVCLPRWIRRTFDRKIPSPLNRHPR